MPTLPSRPALAVVPPTEKRDGERLTEALGRSCRASRRVRLCWLLRVLALITSLRQRKIVRRLLLAGAADHHFAQCCRCTGGVGMGLGVGGAMPMPTSDRMVVARRSALRFRAGGGNLIQTWAFGRVSVVRLLVLGGEVAQSCTSRADLDQRYDLTIVGIMTKAPLDYVVAASALPEGSLATGSGI